MPSCSADNNSACAAAAATVPDKIAVRAIVNLAAICVSTAFTPLNAPFTRVSAAFTTVNDPFTTLNAAFIVVNEADTTLNAAFTRLGMAFLRLSIAFARMTALFTGLRVVISMMNAPKIKINSGKMRGNRALVFVPRRGAGVTGAEPIVTLMSTRTRRRDASGCMDPLLQRRARFEAVLGPIGVWEIVTALPGKMTEFILQRKSPDPQVRVEPTFPDDREHRALRRKIEKAVREASFTVEGTTMRVRDFIAIIVGMANDMKDLSNAGASGALLQFVQQVLPLLEGAIAKYKDAAVRALYDGVNILLGEQSRLDRRMFTSRLEMQSAPKGKISRNVILGAEPAQVREVVLDGKPRPMYRVAECFGGTVRWVSWSGAQVPGLDPARELPIYAQSHALRQLHNRINVPGARDFLEEWMAISLKEPNIVERQGNDLLVEFRLQEHRVGYLIVTPLKNLIAVRTFLFLTMENTPESRLLKKHLRLTRRDVNWLGLHELAAFTQTDLRSDAELMELLGACGCGHLIHVGDEDLTPQPRAFAEEVRKYLRLAA